MRGTISGYTDVERPPEQVFDYVADVTRRSEWQDNVERAEIERGAHAGRKRVRETRRTTVGTRTYTFEVTDDAPKRWSFRGIDGPAQPVGTMTFEPLADAGATRVAIELDFRGLWPITALARRDARRDVPRHLAALKARLETEPPRR